MLELSPGTGDNGGAKLCGKVLVQSADSKNHWGDLVGQGV